MRYELFETDEFIKSIQQLQPQNARFIQNKLETYVYPQLRLEPHFGLNIKKLRNYKPDTWRYRIGDYRVFYTIDENDCLVLLLVVENRDKAYKR
jgi:mRNA interferase RelE/StbE